MTRNSIKWSPRLPVARFITPLPRKRKVSPELERFGIVTLTVPDTVSAGTLPPERASFSVIGSAAEIVGRVLDAAARCSVRHRALADAEQERQIWLEIRRLAYERCGS
jgi:hypothetical protein